MKQKAVLAFSGGLDTSVTVKYLQENHNLDVITVTVNVGQGDNQNKIKAKAKKLGVKKHYNIDARAEFVKDFIFPSSPTSENALSHIAGSASVTEFTL